MVKVNKYKGMAQQLIADIESGRLGPKERLPSEKELQEKFQVSRVTVRKAVDLLEAEGYLYRDHGMGTFISEKVFYKKMNEVVSFTRSSLLRGDIPSTVVHSVSVEEAGAYLARRMRIDPCEKVVHICRTRLTNGFPLIYEDSFWRQEVVGMISAEQAGGSLFTWLKEDRKIIPAYSVQELDAVSADEKIAGLLQVAEQVALLRSMMIFYDRQDRPFELAFNYYRTDRFKLTMVRTLNE